MKIIAEHNVFNIHVYEFVKCSFQGSVKEKEGRIEELEEALRESVKITAEREMLLMEQKMQIDACNNEVG